MAGYVMMHHEPSGNEGIMSEWINEMNEWSSGISPDAEAESGRSSFGRFGWIFTFWFLKKKKHEHSIHTETN